MKAYTSSTTTGTLTTGAEKLSTTSQTMYWISLLTALCGAQVVYRVM